MDDNLAPKDPSSGKRIAVTVGLYVLWFIWVSVVHPIKITALIEPPQTQEDIESYAMFGGIVKALLVVSPYWVIRAIQRKL